MNTPTQSNESTANNEESELASWNRVRSDDEISSFLHRRELVLSMMAQ